METFAQARQFVHAPRFKDERGRITAALDLQTIDAPIRGIIGGFSTVPHCYTLQSCYGHFLHASEGDPRNTEPLPAFDAGPVEYRIAYLAICIENSGPGLGLRQLLEGITEIDPKFVQFGTPEWFWKRHPNSYALQVEPERFKSRDVAIIDYREALQLQNTRARFFERLESVLETCLGELRTH